MEQLKDMMRDSGQTKGSRSKGMISLLSGTVSAWHAKDHW